MKKDKLKLKIIFSAILFFGIFGLAKSSMAATRNVSCSGTIDAALQNAIDASIDGDVVNIGAGSCTISGVSWNNKNITLQGQGIGNTIVTLADNSSIAAIADSKAGFRITAFTFQIGSGDGNAAPIALTNNTSTARSGFRVDHCRFVTTANAGAGAHRIIVVVGILYGVIDNCTFDLAHITAGLSFYPYVNNSEDLSNMGRYSWENNPLDLGGPSAVYIEDCVFNYTGPAGQSRTLDAAYGSRIVYRHNISTDITPMTHWYDGGRRGPLKSEIYDNTFIANREVLDVGWIAGGTGVIFNNTISGAGWDEPNWKFEDRRSCDGDCNGSAPEDVNTSGESGWACRDQIGRGGGATHSQPSVPFYIWNNGSAGVSLQGSCSNPSLQSAHIKTTAHSNGDKDYCVSSTTMPTSCGNHINTYTPYTYPHPLRNEGVGDTTPPAAPSGLSVN